MIVEKPNRNNTTITNMDDLEEENDQKIVYKK